MKIRSSSTTELLKTNSDPSTSSAAYVPDAQRTDAKAILEYATQLEMKVKALEDELARCERELKYRETLLIDALSRERALRTELLKTAR